MKQEGNRVLATVGGVSTVYIAGVYKQTGTSTNRYYPEAGAMRRRSYPTGNGVFYLLNDQLKSTSVIASQAGVEAARQYYYPFGGVKCRPTMYQGWRYCVIDVHGLVADAIVAEIVALSETRALHTRACLPCWQVWKGWADGCILALYWNMVAALMLVWIVTDVRKQKCAAWRRRKALTVRSVILHGWTSLPRGYRCRIRTQRRDVNEDPAAAAACAGDAEQASR